MAALEQWHVWPVVYECKHVVEYTHPPMIGESVWCFKCERMVTVESAPDEWRIRCTRCPYTRRTGAARLNAEIAASKHANKKGHPVAVYNGRKRVYVVGEQNRGQPQLPLMHEDPPF